MFLMVLCLSGFFITNVWNRWNTSPIIVVLDAQGFSIRDKPFPGIAIVCIFHFNWWIILSYSCHYLQYESSAKECRFEDTTIKRRIFSIAKHMSIHKISKSLGCGWWKVGHLPKSFTRCLCYSNRISKKISAERLFSSKLGGTTLQTNDSCMQIWWTRSGLQLYFRYYFDR